MAEKAGTGSEGVESVQEVDLENGGHLELSNADARRLKWDDLHGALAITLQGLVLTETCLETAPAAIFGAFEAARRFLQATSTIGWTFRRCEGQPSQHSLHNALNES